MNKNVSIIILNWNGWKDTVECLESLLQINYPDYDVIVVDNGSHDDSIDKIREYCAGKLNLESYFFNYNEENKPLTLYEYTKNDLESKNSLKIENSSSRNIFLIKNDKNYGFAEGNNIGIKYALNNLNPHYVLLLNNDTVVHKDFLDKLVKAGEISQNIGVLGPLICYYEKPDIVSVFGGNINYIGKTSYPQLDKPADSIPTEEKEIDFVSGSCLLIKRKTLEDIGFLKRTYFLYYEDTELCFRARRNGYKVIYAPAAKIWHKTSPSSISSTGIYYLTRNRFWLMKSYTNSYQYGFFLILFFISYFWFHTIRHLFYYRDLERLKAFYKGIEDGILGYNDN